MRLGNLTMEVSAKDVARSYAAENNYYFITNALIEELLKIPEVNAMMVFHPSEFRYARNLGFFQKEEPFSQELL